MNEFAYSKRMISPCLRGRPPLTKQSLKATRLKILGLTSMAEANQPQYTWISDGAQSDMHVFTICTMYCGMPEKPTWPWNMLISLFVHTWSAITPPARPPQNPSLLFLLHLCIIPCLDDFYPLVTSHSYYPFLAPLVHPFLWWFLSTTDFSFLLHLSDQALMTLQNPQEVLCGWMPGTAAGWPGGEEDKEEEEEEPQDVFFCGEQ